VRSIAKTLSSGGIVRVLMLGPLASPKLVEIVALTSNLDGLWFDQEHAAISQESIENLLRACRASGLDAVVRVPPSDYATTMRPLEAGASGMMAAQIRTVTQVEQIVSWCKYPPLGTRGLFTGNWEARYGDVDLSKYTAATNADRFTAIQIETREALDCVGEISAIPGVDHLFVGTGDLACALGVPGQYTDSRCIDALKQVSKAAAQAGKSWGAQVRDASHAEICRDIGCQLFSIGSDYMTFRLGLKKIQDAFSEVFESTS